jgi:hypothetical protein
LKTQTDTKTDFKTMTDIETDFRTKTDIETDFKTETDKVSLRMAGFLFPSLTRCARSPTPSPRSTTSPRR